MGGSAELLPGDPARLGDYWLAGRLGSGGQGVVYEAYDEGGRRVAIKILYGVELRHGLARELAAAERVAPFCIAQVLGHDLQAPRPYLVSEYVEGPSLRAFVAERGPLDGADLHRLAAGGATALTAIHEAGVIHRDLKPDNVLLGPDGPRVIDFGIARTAEMSLTSTGVVAGTPTYMAPEILNGQRAGTAADVFAWGAIVLFAATGRDPFHAENLGAVMYGVLTAEPDLGDLADPLRSLVAAALRKEPADRPAARELLLKLLGAVPDPLAAGIEQASEVRAGSDDPALGTRAEEVYAGLTPAAQELVPEVFLRMVAAGPDTEDTVRRVSRADLPPGAGDVLAAFEEAGLLAAGGGDFVISRPALLRAWPRLRDWVDAERPGLAVHRELAVAARRWQEGQGDPLQGRTLESALRWAATGRRHLTLNPQERSFLEAGTAAARRRGRVRRLVTSSLAVLLVLALVAGTIAVRQSLDLTEQRDEAAARAVAARAETLRAEDPATAMLLSAAAWHISPAPEARTALFGSLAQPALDVLALGYGRFGADGRTFHTWDDRQVHVWDLTTRRRTGTVAVELPGEDGEVSLSRDGRLAALAGSVEGEGVLLWDLQSGRPAGGLDTRLTGAEFGDGNRVYAATTVGERTQLWRVGGREPVLERGAFESVAISPDDRFVALFQQEGPGEIWDLSHGERLRAPEAGKGQDVIAVRFSPDGRTLAIVRPAEVLLWDVASGEPAGPPLKRPGALSRSSYGPGLVAYSPDGRRLAVLDPDGITLWSTDDRLALTTIPLGRQDVHTLSFDRDGRTLRYLRMDDIMAVVSLDVSTHTRPPSLGGDDTLPARTTIAGHALSPDGRLAALFDRDTATVQLWDVRGRRLLGRLDGLGEPATVTGAWMLFSPDGRTLAITVGPEPMRTSLWDVTARRRLPDLHDPGRVIEHVQAFSPDGRTLAVAVGQDGTEQSRAWDFAGRGMTGTFPIQDRRVLAFVADDRVLTSGAELVELPSGKRTPLAGTGPFSGNVVALSADRRLVAVEEEGRVGIWDTATGALRARVRDVRAGAPASMDGGGAAALAFSPRGDLLASAAFGEIRLWDTTTGQQVGPPFPGPAFTGSLAFDAAGTLHATSGGHDLLDYPTDPARAARAVCARAGRSLTEAEWRRYIPYVPYRREVCA
ncbi:WD40 repeat domain-containing serine/threonine protein kinase [Nonomuraea gerenzanensis]|uniref:WD40 repeat domain-containing serine/threonine protein kinase n=1 Tax=Nonomuraea gerenzanensis TaxID=93944 RepID=UPI001CD978AF|nr:WD40 repeat domain-containing serine/threonine protein kinase [Nonomuraea gerenzanensis]UBU14904.1 WD40 repeat domain-containing serine/threonine protein kinase [Nonomuraea gerenzanensis]